MRIYINQKTGLQEFLYSARLVKIGDLLNSDKSNSQYRVCNVEVEYPNGTTDIISSILWESLRLSDPKVFFIDNSINIIVKAEGEYAGNSTITLDSSDNINSKEIKRIYIGLPVHIATQILWVDVKFRTNPLSKQPGGNDIVVEYKDGKALGYDNIKVPSIYVDKIISDQFQKSFSKFEELNRIKKIEVIKTYINRVYARSYKNNSEFLDKPYEEIWDSNKHNSLPSEALQEFELKNNFDFIF